jgi:nucleoside-diphosphate-sugar epimerase
MKILLTGGAGFIGSHLAERLLDDGHGVTVLDNLSTGSLGNVAHLTSRQQFECVIGSVRDASLVDELVQSCDVVVHMAAAVGVRLILEKPSLSIHTNVNGTENVVHAASSRNKLVIIVSTSEVYGKSTKMPFAEDDDLVLGSTANLRWSYACAKALDECLALSYAQENKLAAIIVRLFNTTGPRQTGHYGMVLPGFVGQALKGEPITVYGSGRQSRCFAHVADVVESLVRLMNTPSALGQIFNVGNDEEISIEDLAAKVKDATGSASVISKLPYRDVYGAGFEDMARRVPDVRKLERYTGYRPRTSLDRIIADIVAEQRAALGQA